MPVVPSSTLDDIQKSQRKKLEALLFERAVAGYTFSYAGLLRLAGGDANKLKKCVLAYTEDEAKEVKEIQNDQISSILSENNVTSLAHLDPFNRMRVCSVYGSVSSSFVQSRALEMCSKFGVSPDVLAKIFEAATNKKDITVVAVKDVKEKTA